MAPDQRESLWAIESRYNDNTDKATLQTLIKAFRGIVALPPEDPNSFFCLAGFHGEPFRGNITDPKAWWGGYCHHGDVLFPMWHRAYVLRLENALRSIPGCDTVRLPFWDELFGYGTPTTIPTILTSPTFEEAPNPLFSYRLQKGFPDGSPSGSERYTKPKGYETVRYPLSGLVGTEEDRIASEFHNFKFDKAERVKILNENVANWLTGDVHIPDDDSDNPTPKPKDVTAVKERLIKCLQAPNYTAFSNNRSAAYYNNQGKTSADIIAVSLESPHNSIHLAVGGFYQRGEYNASPIIGANGDMGANEVAGFDPIFFFHHCFIDYAFWTWQKINKCTTVGSITIDSTYDGATTDVGLPVPEGAPARPAGTKLTMESALYPFLKDDATTYLTPNDLVDIKTQLGYDYSHGSLDPILLGKMSGIPRGEVPLIQKISGVNRNDYFGSFVVRLYGYTTKGERFEVGREAVLSRLKVEGCANCQNSLDQEFFIPLHQDLIPILEKQKGDNTKFRTSVGIHTYDGEIFPEETKSAKVPIVTTL